MGRISIIPFRLERERRDLTAPADRCMVLGSHGFTIVEALALHAFAFPGTLIHVLRRCIDVTSGLSNDPGVPPARPLRR